MDELRISPGNGKLGGIPNVSLLPGPAQSCGENARHCVGSCYAVKFVRMWKEVREAWTHNTRIVFACERERNWNPVLYSVVEYLYRRPRPLFRWHVSGDWISQGHFDAACQIAEACPDTQFLSYTKREGLEWGNRPANFSMRVSQWPGLAYGEGMRGMPNFWATTTENPGPEGALVCPDDCTQCQACWDEGVVEIVNPMHR